MKMLSLYCSYCSAAISKLSFGFHVSIISSVSPGEFSAQFKAGVRNNTVEINIVTGVAKSCTYVRDVQKSALISGQCTGKKSIFSVHECRPAFILYVLFVKLRVAYIIFASFLRN